MNENIFKIDEKLIQKITSFLMNQWKFFLGFISATILFIIFT